MEAAILFCFVLLIAMGKDDASEDVIFGITWAILTLLVVLVGSFAAYVMITGLVGLVIGGYESLKKL